MLPLAGLKAAGGVFFVTGNHENLNGGDPSEWVEFMRQQNITTLENKRVEVAAPAPVPAPKCTFDLAGVSDWSLQPNISAAMEGRSRERPCVLLSHQPQVSDRAE